MSLHESGLHESVLHESGSVNDFIPFREMSTWDINDGRCVETTRLQYIHTNIQVRESSGSIR